MHSDRELEHLNGVLGNIEVISDAMCVRELDGFVAGLLVCPEIIMASEWLPDLWAMNGEPEFCGAQEAQDTIGAVMGHYNRVADNLAKRSSPYDFLLEHAEGEDASFWEFWISGFEQAILLRPHSWTAYETCDDKGAEAVFDVIMLLIDLASNESQLPKIDQKNWLTVHPI